MLILLSIIAWSCVIYFALKVFFDTTPREIFLDWIGADKAKKADLRENLMVLRNAVNKASQLSEIEIAQVNTVLTHRNPLPSFSGKDTEPVARALKAMEKGALSEAERIEALKRIDEMIDRCSG